MYSKYFNNFRGAIIPHAGIQYAGSARSKIFENLNENDKYIENIIYLSALHNIDTNNKKINVLEHHEIFNDFLLDKTIYEIDNLSAGAKKEHSYEWVKMELKHYFKNAKILVLAPSLFSDLKQLATNIINWIEKQNTKTLIIATTDLTHYGDRFNNTNLLINPIELNKWRYEEKLITNLLNNEIDYTNYEIMCGRFAVETFIYIAQHFKWNSKILDYYDSNSYQKNMIDRYSIDFNDNIKEFVSYIVIIYGDFDTDTNILPFEIAMLIGTIKNNIYMQLYDLKYDISIPKWCSIYKLTNGIFVGTEINNVTNSCYGNFEIENNITNSFEKIINSSSKCLNDSINRWKNPITKENLNKCNIKIEILDKINNWEVYKSNTALENFKLDGTYGMLLFLNNRNSTVTYLPTVAEENKNIWSIADYMNNLTIKGGGDVNDWLKNENIMKLYKTSIIKYNNIENKIMLKYNFIL